MIDQITNYAEVSGYVMGLDDVSTWVCFYCTLSWTQINAALATDYYGLRGMLGLLFKKYDVFEWTIQ